MEVSIDVASILKVRDADGTVHEIHALQGKSAYQYAVEGGYTGTEEEFAAKLAEEIPDALPNPNALTFTGAVTGSYDGSAPLEVEIPSGGGAAGDYIPIPASAEVGQTIVVKAVDENSKPTEWEAADMPSGADGRGIRSITGNDDGTWTVTYTDGTTEKISEEAYMALLSEMSAKLDALATKIDNLPSGGGGGGVSLADVDVYVADFYTDEVAVTAGALDVYKRIIIS